MTGLSNAEETIQDQLIKGATNLNSGSALRQVYVTLEEIFHHGGLLSYINQMTIRPINQKTKIIIRQDSNRHHFNPELEFRYCEGIPYRAGILAWIVGCSEWKRACQDAAATAATAASSSASSKKQRSGPAFCSAFLVLFNNIEQLSIIREERISNPTYGLGFYNTPATLWKKCLDKSETSNIVMHESDSAILALKNIKNGDSKDQLTRLVEMIMETPEPRDQKIIKYLWPNLALRKLRNIRRGRCR